MLTNEKYIGTVRLADSFTGECEYLVKGSHPPIITDDFFRDALEAKERRSNIVTDENGTHRSDKKYSSKKNNILHTTKAGVISEKYRIVKLSSKAQSIWGWCYNGSNRKRYYVTV